MITPGLCPANVGLMTNICLIGGGYVISIFLVVGHKTNNGCLTSALVVGHKINNGGRTKCIKTFNLISFTKYNDVCCVCLKSVHLAKYSG